MFLIKTYTGPDTHGGTGVFNGETRPILPGEIIWVHDDAVDRTVKVSDLERRPPHVREFFEKYAYPVPVLTADGRLEFDTTQLILNADDGRFCNHDEDFNFIEDDTDPQTMRAVRVIYPGEEITCHYSRIEPDFPGYPANRVAIFRKQVRRLICMLKWHLRHGWTLPEMAPVASTSAAPGE